MRRLIAAVLLSVLATSPLFAQGIPVFDLESIAKISEIIDQVRTALNIAREEYETVTRIGTRFRGALGRYKIASIPTANHDAGRYLFARPLLEGLNSGDPRGERYTQVMREVLRPGGLFDRMSPEARRLMESAFATLEIYDSVSTLGIHQAAQARGYGTEIGRLIEQLEADVTNTGSEYHETTTVADKLSVAGLINARQNQSSNQIESSILEQLLAKNMRTRNAAAAHNNMVLSALRDKGDLSASMFENAGSTLKHWHLPY